MVSRKLSGRAHLNENKTIFISAGDPSGDIAAAKVCESLKIINPNIDFIGLGNNKLKAIGQRQLVDGARLSVIGFWEVFKNFFFFKKLLNDAAREIKRTKPSVVVLVDYPGFNLRLAQKIKSENIPIIYYISPQVWAWGKGRYKEIKELIDFLICILPFEKKLFDSHDIKSAYVGHYLMEDIPSEMINSSPLISNTTRLALLPGSRPQEIEKMLPVMLDTLRILRQDLDIQATIAGISNIFEYEKHIPSDLKEFVEIKYDDSREVIYGSDITLTSSGTATLEVGIINRPMVVIYKTGKITFEIAKRLIKVDHIALVNLVLGKRVVPELIQQDASPQIISDELHKIISDSNKYDQMKNELGTIPEILGGKGASQKTAELIHEYLK